MHTWRPTCSPERSRSRFLIVPFCSRRYRRSNGRVAGSRGRRNYRGRGREGGGGVVWRALFTQRPAAACWSAEGGDGPVGGGVAAAGPRGGPDPLLLRAWIDPSLTTARYRLKRKMRFVHDPPMVLSPDLKPSPRIDPLPFTRRPLSSRRTASLMTRCRFPRTHSFAL